MKTTKITSHTLTIILLIGIIFLCSNCMETRLPSYSSNLIQKNQKISSDKDLTYFLRSVPELQVNGHREYAKIKNRVNVKFMTSEFDTPLFIVDGMDMGNEYVIVYRNVNVEDIRKIRVLNDASAIATYGRRGMNGIILIETIHKL